MRMQHSGFTGVSSGLIAKTPNQIMKTRPYRTGGLLGALFLSLGTLSLQAQEDRPAPPPPQKERPAPPKDGPEGMRAEKIRQRIKELHDAGKHEEANQMAERMKQAHMRMSARPTADRMPRDKREQASGQKADRKENRRPHPKHPEHMGPHSKMGPPPIMKIRNLKMAAGLLEAAGYREYADKARHEADRVEAEVRKMLEAKKHEDEKRRAEEAKRRDGEKAKAEEAKKRPDPAAEMREEMKKLRRELEEVRNQLKKAKAEAESRPERDAQDADRSR
jgi:flagellar biosynthesis GTPase FlhF